MAVRIIKKYTILLCFVILTFAAFLWLEKQQFTVVIDDTHKFSSRTVSILQSLKGEKLIRFEVYSNPASVVTPKITAFLNRIIDINNQIQYEVIDPATHPDKVRENGITMEGEIVVTYADEDKVRKINITELSESRIINSIIRLQSDSDKWIVFAEGYGMSSINDESPAGLTDLLFLLKKSGFPVARIEPTSELSLPESVRLIILPSPTEQLEEDVVQWLQLQLQSGVSLWWLTDSYSVNQDYLELALDVMTGSIAKTDGQETTGVVDSFADHPITTQFNQPVFIANAVALISESLKSFISISDNMSIALAGDFIQNRVVITGDTDFVTNRYIHLAANESLILRIADWLMFNDKRLNLPVYKNDSAQLYITQSQLIIMSVVILIVIPLIFLIIAWKQWRLNRAV